jgi:hypothetical protein
MFHFNMYATNIINYIQDDSEGKFATINFADSI